MANQAVKLYAVIYTWQGQRHRHGALLPLKEANALCAEFRRDRWNSWIELVT